MWRNGAESKPSVAAYDHQFLERGDGSCWIEALRTVNRTIHDGVTAIRPKRILEYVESFTGGLIPTIDDPSVGLQ